MLELMSDERDEYVAQFGCVCVHFDLSSLSYVKWLFNWWLR